MPTIYQTVHCLILDAYTASTQSNKVKVGWGAVGPYKAVGPHMAVSPYMAIGPVGPYKAVGPNMAVGPYNIIVVSTWFTSEENATSVWGE